MLRTSVLALLGALAASPVVSAAAAASSQAQPAAIPPAVVRATLAALPQRESAPLALMDARHWARGKLGASSHEFVVFMPVFQERHGGRQAGIFVFTTSPAHDDYRPVTRSQLWAEDCEYMHSDDMCNDTISIDKGYLWYWRVTYTSDCDRIGHEAKCQPVDTVMQFRLEDGTIRLIGLDVSIHQGLDRSSAPPSSGSRIADCSINYVTRDKIVRDKHTGRRAEHATKLNLTGPLSLESFVPYSEVAIPGGMRADLACTPDGHGGFTDKPGRT
jgi:hypothetical protein